MIRGIWHRETVALLLLCASLPIAITWLLADGWGAVARLAFVALSIGIWQLIWMLARAQPPSFAVFVTALTIAILAPEQLSALQLVLGVSLGIVFGELAFGGWGRNILNPATVTLAILGFGFPAAPWPELPIQLGWAAIPTALVAACSGWPRYACCSVPGCFFCRRDVCRTGFVGDLACAASRPHSAGCRSCRQRINAAGCVGERRPLRRACRDVPRDLAGLVSRANGCIRGAARLACHAAGR